MDLEASRNLRFALPPPFHDSFCLCLVGLFVSCAALGRFVVQRVATGSADFSEFFPRVYFGGTLFGVMAIYALSATRYELRGRGLRVRRWFGPKLVPWNQVKSIAPLPRIGCLRNVLILRLHFWGLTRWLDSVPIPKCIVLYLPRAEHASVLALWNARGGA
jgi:hypothetical protein